MIKQGPSQKLTSPRRLHDLIYVKLLVSQALFSVRIQPLVPVFAIIPLEAAAEETAEDLASVEAQAFPIEQGCEQILDVLLVDLLPAGHISAYSGLSYKIEPLPKR